MATVVLCDDHQLVMEGQQRILESLGHQVVGRVSNGRAVVEFYRQTPVDLVIMDLSMPVANGMDALVRLREVSWAVRVMIMSMHEDIGRIARAFTMGANGYLTKTVDPKEFGQAVTDVLAGGTYLNLPVSAEEFREAVQEAQRKRGYLGEPVLSTREREVLQLIGEGYSHKQMAGELNLSIHTIRDHQEHIKAVMGLRTTADLVKLSVTLGLTSL
jgi:DNA-binding NarL/FixJ family response regulator